MIPHQNITVLIANAEAEEVKTITIGFRTVFPGCRVETIFSADDILDWVSRHEWQVVFLDEPLLQSSAMTLIPEIRKRLPRSAINLQIADLLHRVSCRSKGAARETGTAGSVGGPICGGLSPLIRGNDGNCV
jgi:DNA-binding NtrC family response regulator